MNNNFFYIDSTKAQSLINICENNNNDKKGSNKKVWIVDNYAILKCSNIPIKDLTLFPNGDNVFEIVIKKLFDLHNQGVNVVPILGYSFYPEKIDNFGESSYAPGYIFQPKAKGEELWQRSDFEDKEKLLEKIKLYANAPQKHYDKFVEDYITILKNDIMIDPSKKANFFYDSEQGFSFIDLDCVRNFAEEDLTIYGFLPCLQFLHEFSMPVLTKMTQKELEILQKNNVEIFNKCVTAMIKNKILTNEILDKSIKEGKCSVVGLNKIYCIEDFQKSK